MKKTFKVIKVTESESNKIVNNYTNGKTTFEEFSKAYTECESKGWATFFAEMRAEEARSI